MNGKYRSFYLGLVVVVLVALACGGIGGGTQSDPEDTARAWVDAVVAGDCDKAGSYVAPDRRKNSNLEWICTDQDFGLRLQTARIDDAVVRDFRVNQKEVTFIGQFEKSSTSRDNMKVWLEEIDGKWYVFDYN